MKPLSFVIITYNRPADMLELLKNISTLQHAAELLQEVIILNNASTSDYSEVREYVSSNQQLPFRYFDAPDNLGVARGRNYALDLGTAPLVIMLDDDAVLQNADCLVRLQELLHSPEGNRPRAIISFKVLYYDTLQMQKNALPHKQYEERKHLDFFETYYYAGGAHAIKRSVLEQVGKYPEDFFYGMEEYDMSYRILEAGYSISYSSAVVMLHKESPLGRKPKEEKIRMMWVNKATVAYRYLPIRYFYSTAVMWSIKHLSSSGFDVRGFIEGWRSVIRIPVSQKRRPLTGETMAYLKAVRARLWY